MNRLHKFLALNYKISNIAKLSYLLTGIFGKRIGTGAKILKLGIRGLY